MNAITPQAAPTPHHAISIPIEPQRERAMKPWQGDLSRAMSTQKANRERWAALALNPDTQLRQQWADGAWMRDHLKAAGLVVRSSNEPATVTRLKALLRSVGVHGPEVLESVGTDLAGFLRLNPKLPLWAALALVLEASGRFPPAVGT